MLCCDCPHLVTRRVGYVSTRSFCRISQGSQLKGTKLGVQPWLKKPHPKCPLRKKEANNQ